MTSFFLSVFFFLQVAVKGFHRIYRLVGLRSLQWHWGIVADLHILLLMTECVKTSRPTKTICIPVLFIFTHFSTFPLGGSPSFWGSFHHIIFVLCFGLVLKNKMVNCWQTSSKPLISIKFNLFSYLHNLSTIKRNKKTSYYSKMINFGVVMYHTTLVLIIFLCFYITLTRSRSPACFLR